MDGIFLWGGGIPPTKRSFSGGGILASMGGDFGFFGFMGGTPHLPPVGKTLDPMTGFQEKLVTDGRQIT